MKNIFTMLILSGATLMFQGCLPISNAYHGTFVSDDGMVQLTIGPKSVNVLMDGKSYRNGRVFDKFKNIFDHLKTGTVGVYITPVLLFAGISAGPHLVHTGARGKTVITPPLSESENLHEVFVVLSSENLMDPNDAIPEIGMSDYRATIMYMITDQTKTNVDSVEIAFWPNAEIITTNPFGPSVQNWAIVKGDGDRNIVLHK